MIENWSILQVLLASTCLLSIGLGDAQVNRVAWLDNVRTHDPTSPKPVAAHAASHEVEHIVLVEDGAESQVNISVFSGVGKREPRRKSHNNHSGNDTQTDDSSVGKIDISVPLSIGASLVIIIVFF
ncbi:hypothetical protein F4813DRAFT_385531 [Daldinia decipiens]|uniref:uncharacterized protein n=1 Tax=Daldinia decipiens TaxID=326647 RepID=UPI0020C4178E|nr:uncharacterized protein F4813DRAFT_385531 [Daldinia decipiens]KAI1661860.1 hypothetical protein F4813DRAFT_385531 [Daldinia decipiens]